MKLSLIPHANVTPSQVDGFDWFASNSDPQFSLLGAHWLAGRKIRIVFDLKTAERLVSAPKIYWDSGTGLSEAHTIGLKISSAGKVDQEISLPSEIRALRIDPMAQDGSFSLNSFNVDVLGSSDANTLYAAVDDGKTYSQWIELYEPKADSYPAYQQRSRTWNKRPLISIVMPTYNSPERWLCNAIDSVLAQVYENWELCIADDASTSPHVKGVLDEYARQDQRIKLIYRNENGHISAASNSALALATGEFIGLLDHDDELHPLALYGVVQAFNAHQNAKLIYTDEDKITETGNRHTPYFKCDFNYDLFLSQNMICHFAVYRTDVVRHIEGFRIGYEGSQDYDLALRFIDQIDKENIIHVPHVLYHWREHPASTAQTHENKPYAQIAAQKSIVEHLHRNGIDARVEQAPGVTNYQWVRYALPNPVPLVEIIIPTRDGAELVRMCVRSILEKTEYPNYMITIIDNGSVQQATFDLFAFLKQDSRVRIIRDESPFNYAAINNRLALNSTAECICLLNNDIEVITPHWLCELVSIAVQPGVGCVGARLWYPNNTLQHGGVVLGVGGVAGHSHKHLPQYTPGYFSRAMVRSSYSAVTGACLLIRAQIYREVEGLDEGLAVAFNDVDFCIRVREAGYRNVWTPFAELIHHESATRGYEDSPEKVARFNKEIERIQKRWGSLLMKDPCYSPNLTLETEDFAMAWPPRDSLINE